MTNRKRMWHRTAVAVALLGAVGCGMRPAPVPPPSPASGGVARGPVNQTENLERLNRLHAQRNAQATDGDYQLGKRFNVKVESAGGHVKVWYDGAAKADLPINSSTSYFKAGA